MFLMIDNYDSFVYNLVRYFEEIGEEIYVVRNDKISIAGIRKLSPEGIVLSPGPKVPKEAGICLKLIDAFKGSVPILGVCLGHQVIAEYFGAIVCKGMPPMHGKISEVYHEGVGMFRGLKNPIKVTRYHSLVVRLESLPSELTLTAATADGVVMGIKHKNFCIEGVQFHPEAELTEFGHEMLKNFIEEAKVFNNRRCRFGVKKN